METVGKTLGEKTDTVDLEVGRQLRLPAMVFLGIRIADIEMELTYANTMSL
jgi:hypothetical protein